MSSEAVPSFENQPTVRGLAEGQRYFGRFVLLRPLGRGGMGVVWLARDETLGEQVALKFLPDLVRWDPAALAELKAETRRSRQLAHPGIVRIYDLFEDASGAAIAMEYIEGRTLSEVRLAQTAQVLEAADIAPWIGQLATALDYAHQQARVVHRDLKPSNLMLTRDGRIKVTDFGVARTLGETMLRVSQLATGGTLLYMSPQQALGEPPSPRDDIYALGATLYELLTGKPPFYTGNVAAQLERRKPDTISTRRRLLGTAANASIPPTWEETIAACLSKQPEERPGSAGEVAARLLAEVTKGKRRRWLPPRAVWLALLAVVLTFSTWQVRRTLVTDSLPRGTEVRTFDSDKTRAYAAWNFDGDGREASGRGLDFSLSRTAPTTDRWGRIDRAVQLNGASAIQREIPDAVGWSGGDPFSVAVWVRPTASAVAQNSGSVLVSMRNERQEDLYWNLESGPTGIIFHFGRTQVDDSIDVVATEQLPVGHWSHLAAVSDGREARIYVNGRQVARGQLTLDRAARFNASPTLSVGLDHKFDLERFAGAVDELRLWRRALSNAELGQLAASEPSPGFVLSAGNYAASDDLAAAITREFGPGATLADWKEILRWHADDTEAWCEEVPIPRLEGGPLVQRDGQRHSASTRHYFLNRFDGKKPDYFLAHGELGGMRLALGSWTGISSRALVRLPFVSPHREQLVANPTGNVEREFAAPVEASQRRAVALALEWTQELKPVGGSAARVELLLRDGRRMVAVCAPSSTGALAVALGAEGQPEFSRQLPGGFGPLRFCAVVRMGKLILRAANPIGASVAFAEETLVDFSAGDIARVTLRGVDSATITVEE